MMFTISLYVNLVTAGLQEEHWRHLLSGRVFCNVAQKRYANKVLPHDDFHIALRWSSHSQVYSAIFISNPSKCPGFKCWATWTFSLDVWMWNKQTIYKNLQMPSVYWSLPFFSQEINTYSSITLPNFLTGAIIETWFQALLPAPPLPLPKTNSTHMAVGWNKPTPQCWTDCTQSMNITAATHPQYCSPSQQFFQT